LISTLELINCRNYHVFYYLLNGASPELSSELFLLQSQEYQYLNQVGLLLTSQRVA